MTETVRDKNDAPGADRGRVYQQRDGRWSAQVRITLGDGRSKSVTTHHLTRGGAERGLAELRENASTLKLLAERPLPFF